MIEKKIKKTAQVKENSSRVSEWGRKPHPLKNLQMGQLSTRGQLYYELQQKIQ